ncbi:hypothetical protein PLICRDRAFT_338335 [Plicaturopsis crispa FD-325 SS-3]|uniref:Secreted protein n=1 Tax=Plicaturopsis crispa FD-325 SS-3 TaxID=944288 RepID=A0A0C9T7I2_PLICR|nr:hypothetical protein PLICRDRAFT_338335 [Plicaturopsis crispa FD-325 SS-3]
MLMALVEMRLLLAELIAIVYVHWSRGSAIRIDEYLWSAYRMSIDRYNNTYHEVLLLLDFIARLALLRPVATHSAVFINAGILDVIIDIIFCNDFGCHCSCVKYARTRDACTSLLSHFAACATDATNHPVYVLWPITHPSPMLLNSTQPQRDNILHRRRALRTLGNDMQRCQLLAIGCQKEDGAATVGL